MENLESNILKETNSLIENMAINQILNPVAEEVRKIMREDPNINLPVIYNSKDIKASSIKWYLLS